VRLLGDAALRRRLAENGATVARQKYDWNVIGQTLEEIYQRER